MENNVDFIYEFSDLNLFYTRVKILTGRYESLVIEFGSSGLAQWENKNNFNFDYVIYEIPEQLQNYKLRGVPEFEEFLAYLLVDVINDRNKDSDWKDKLDESASYEGVQSSKIKIDNKWYPQELLVFKNRQQPKAVGLQGF